MKKVVDTNVLIDYVNILNDEQDIVILSDVLKELDGLKNSSNTEVAFKARRAAILLSRMSDEIEWDFTFEDRNIPVDDKLIKFCETKDCELITNDVYLKIKAKAKGIDTHGYGNFVEYEGVFTTYIDLNKKEDNDFLNDLIDNQNYNRNNHKFSENEFLIVKDVNDPFTRANGTIDYTTIGTLMYRNGKFENFYDGVIKNKWIDKIVPRNAEQSCLFTALKNRDISIIYASGKYGTGY